VRFQLSRVQLKLLFDLFELDVGKVCLNLEVKGGFGVYYE
jgi:hypothetical protein